jgi:hypothetical protein
MWRLVHDPRLLRLMNELEDATIRIAAVGSMPIRAEAAACDRTKIEGVMTVAFMRRITPVDEQTIHSMLDWYRTAASAAASQPIPVRGRILKERS